MDLSIGLTVMHIKTWASCHVVQVAWDFCIINHCTYIIKIYFSFFVSKVTGVSMALTGTSPTMV